MDNILNRLEKVSARGLDKKNRRNWRACCPAHSDKDPSLLITEDTGRALFYCRSGCDQASIINALKAAGLTSRDLNWDPDWKPKARPVFTDYHEFLILIAESDMAKGKRLSIRDKALYKDAKMRRALA